MKYKPIGGGGEFWPKDSDEGTSLIGLLVAKEEVENRFNPGTSQVLLTFQTADESMKRIAVSAGLKSKEPYMHQGRAYRVTFEGRKKGKGPLPFKSFSVSEIENYDPAQVVPF